MPCESDIIIIHNNYELANIYSYSYLSNVVLLILKGLIALLTFYSQDFMKDAATCRASYVVPMQLDHNDEGKTKYCHRIGMYHRLQVHEL